MNATYLDTVRLLLSIAPDVFATRTFASQEALLNRCFDELDESD